jgi:LemA protein
LPLPVRQSFPHRKGYGGQVSEGGLRPAFGEEAQRPCLSNPFSARLSSKQFYCRLFFTFYGSLKMGAGALIGLVLVVGIIIFAVGIYNGLIRKRIATENAWSQIDVQLKRRYDLIPNLVETVKGYASHEKETLERVIQARNAAISAGGGDNIKEQAAAENMLSGALRQIFALSESYPDLKANENFAQLQEELTSTENRISFARQHYNDSVGVYNTSIQQIPGNIIAGISGFKAKDFFELDPAEAEAAKEPPKVSF